MGKPDKPSWSRQQIADRILRGENLVIYRNQLISISPNWLEEHPGGSIAILHFVGRDASDEIEAFHPNAAIQRLLKHSIGDVQVGEEGWDPLLPPIAAGWVRKVTPAGSKWHREAERMHSDHESHFTSTSQVLLVRRGDLDTSADPSIADITPPPTILSPKVQAAHSKAYRALHQRIADAGLYQTRYITGYGPEIVRYTSLFIIAVIAYHFGWYKTAALFHGFLWHQLVFTAHDLGHVGVTHNWVFDRILGITIANFMGGLSISWWTKNHNTHHLVTNHPTHDPDIEHLPFFANTPEFLKSIYSSYYGRILPFDFLARALIPFQHYLFYVVLSLARFNLYRLSYAHLISTITSPKKRNPFPWYWWLEMVGLCVFYYWYTAVLRGIPDWSTRIAYVLITNIVPSPLHVQLVLSHYSRQTADLGPTESFAARQLRTTVDVFCPPSLAFLHGGLHLQVTHHLFPRLPRHNLMEASLMVKEFAKEWDLEYAEIGFIRGNQDVRDVLRQVADQAKIVGIVAEHHVQEAMKKST